MKAVLKQIENKSTILIIKFFLLFFLVGWVFSVAVSKIDVFRQMIETMNMWFRINTIAILKKFFLPFSGRDKICRFLNWNKFHQVHSRTLQLLKVD
jgi:hypothetical protein